MLVDELLSISLSSDFDLEIFRRYLTTRKQCFRLLLEQKNADPIGVRFNWVLMKFVALLHSMYRFLHRREAVFVLQ